jgi:multidrug efflux pump subunit AcrB
MVRYPQAERRSLADVDNMRIRTPEGGEVPFATVAHVEHGRGYATIQRADRRRVVTVSADVDAKSANANEVLGHLSRTILPQLTADYPGLRFELEGEQREQRETMGALGRNFLFALFVIYTLLAVPLRSYVQPLIVMTAIPFGITGAVWAHKILGMDLSFLSVFGIVALTGVVVNDSLVLVDYVNNCRTEGRSVLDAVREAGAARFRPIMLVSGTTFIGLLPLLLERSLQAQFLVPMGVSLGFGSMFATSVSLLLVPCVYLILEDVRVLARRRHRAREHVPAAEAARGTLSADSPSPARRDALTS